jgi:hypothetical protein
MEQLKQAQPKKSMTVFVSSTFLDTNLERDVLHRKILIFYDMRFGVKDENTLDHMTWVACKEAIQQCHEGSDGLFSSLSLQGDRYGYLPLPKYLDEEVLLKARKDHQSDSNFSETLKLLEKWYVLDENHCPSGYELKSLLSINDSEYWNRVLPTLRDTLFDSVAFERLASLPDQNLLVNRSVTEFDYDKERCYWVQRSFQKDSLREFKDDPNCFKLTEKFTSPSSAMKLEFLQTKMKMHLKEDQRCELFAEISPESYLKNEGCEEYLEKWEAATRDCLEKDLDKVIEKSEKWNTGFAGISVDHLEEMHHCSTAFKKVGTFFGRSDLLESAVEKLTRAKMDNSLFSGIDLALVGKSGCGKTAMMSKLALSSFDAQFRQSFVFVGLLNIV